MKINVLIYPCGADNAYELYESLRYSLHLNVFGANATESAADLIFENEIIRLPNISADNFLSELNEVIETYHIDLIFPTHDDVVFYFSQHTNKINTKIVGADKLINEVARSKKKTYDFLTGFSFIPKAFNTPEEITEFPVFCKPDKGHGSIGVFKVKRMDDLTPVIFEDNVISEFLPGSEYTVDCFSDKDNRLLFAFPRKRHFIRNGVSHINIEPEQKIIDECFNIGKKINEKLKFKGLWFFQVKEDKNENLKLLEICPRIATTMAFARFKGVNLPFLSVFAYLDKDVETNIFHKDVELYRFSYCKAKYNFQYDHVYIDLDDTIIINGKVCLDAISLVYQLSLIHI